MCRLTTCSAPQLIRVPEALVNRPLRFRRTRRLMLMPEALVNRPLRLFQSLVGPTREVQWHSHTPLSIDCGPQSGGKEAVSTPGTSSQPRWRRLPSRTPRTMHAKTTRQNQDGQKGGFGRHPSDSAPTARKNPKPLSGKKTGEPHHEATGTTSRLARLENLKE